MYSVASGWLMTSLDPNAFIVSMVQVANSLPMFLFAIPAGALADIVNQRRFLIIGESTITIVSAAFAALVWLHVVTPGSLLLFSFIVTVGSAMTAPAWQSVVTKLVPRRDCHRPLLLTVWASTLAVPSGRLSAASSSERWEFPRPSGSMPSATLGSSRLSSGGVHRRKAAHPCRPSPSSAPCAPGSVMPDTTHISERL